MLRHAYCKPSVSLSQKGNRNGSETEIEIRKVDRIAAQGADARVVVQHVLELPEGQFQRPARSLRQGPLATEARMPDKSTLKRAAQDRRAGKSASTQAGEFVRQEMHHIREPRSAASHRALSRQARSAARTRAARRA